MTGSDKPGRQAVGRGGDVVCVGGPRDFGTGRSLIYRQILPYFGAWWTVDWLGDVSGHPFSGMGFVFPDFVGFARFFRSFCGAP